MPRQALVAYGTKNGSTRQIAEAIGTTLRSNGIEAEVYPASDVEDVDPYDMVVLGGALYEGRWHRDAVRFARRHRAALLNRAVWLFSSGPLDSTAAERDIPPVRGARRAQASLDARQHVTFGGRLEAGASGRMARMIVESGRGGDFRDFDRIAAWATGIAQESAAEAQLR
ncbi:flavodoxin domain-containing protein [Streptomyces beijiangensis]|uniref:Flavodoxin domain-containing protein n=1 Tax=Streptomyces beijiangensis TaxID=163361 RepID=A0A939F7L3_9ACTN|nr:flavodoxin domain-containing protein [Streptomyces beijiangensis]MBO0513296.1 flavodoxin domain-containing protein [Streptomyces beijiangensis]